MNGWRERERAVVAEPPSVEQAALELTAHAVADLVRTLGIHETEQLVHHVEGRNRHRHIDHGLPVARYAARCVTDTAGGTASVEIQIERCAAIGDGYVVRILDGVR